MSSSFLMNDTLDDYYFTETEKFKNPSDYQSFKIIGLEKNPQTLESISDQLVNQIIFDDSQFLSESWSQEADESKKNEHDLHTSDFGWSSFNTNGDLDNILKENNINNFKKDNVCQDVSITVDSSKTDRDTSNKESNNHDKLENSLSEASTDDSLFSFSTSSNEIEQNDEPVSAHLQLNIQTSTSPSNSQLNFDCSQAEATQTPSTTNDVITKAPSLDINTELSPNQNKPLSDKEISSEDSVTVTSSRTQLSLKSRTIQKDAKLSSWGLPATILEKYSAKNLHEMFQWQIDCLSNKEVVENCKNFVYSAPTSAGKTLVAEILAIKTVLERKKKVIFILPFVSIVREKMFYFQDLLGSNGIRVEGFMGSYNPPGGFGSVNVAICTIEKANSLINRLMEEEKMSDVGAVIVDEMHLLGDTSRGYLLELLLTKLRYMSLKNENVKIQIISMSATLPNLSVLSKWLDAELYTTDYRPVPLYEQTLIGNIIYDKDLKNTRTLPSLPELGVDTDHILQLCLETIQDSSSVLIFCPTKNWCENLAQQISMAIHKLGNSNNKFGESLRTQLNGNLIKELLQQLRYCPIGLDEILRKTVSFGVAFHHAGLTMDERDIIEGGFRSTALRVLVATSTLSSGVNLPARRVIIRSPMFHGKPIDTLVYRQMIGRAGRMGKDTVGESFLICQKNDYKLAKELMSAELRPVESCLECAGKLKRAILEVIASGVASSPHDVDLFTKCTLLAAEQDLKTTDKTDLSNPIEEAVYFLKNNELIRLQKKEDGTEIFIATSLGKACLSSSIAPDEGLALFTELDKARQCFVLDSELHLIYLVTPYNACHSWGNIDWMFYLDLWEKLPPSMKRVGELVGVSESYIVNAARGRISTSTHQLYRKMLVHKRFFIALALQDLVNEKSLAWVCHKFSCNRGMLQSLQQSASSFAGMVTAFSRQLGWSTVELLISQFQDRLQFGVSRDLLDLMHLPILSGKVARILFNASIETVVQLANSKIADVENILYKSIPFESEKIKEGESEFDKRQRNKFRNVWVTGKEGLTEHEAAEILVSEARKYLKLEMGLAEAKWETTGDEESLEHKQVMETNEEEGQGSINQNGTQTALKNFIPEQVEEVSKGLNVADPEDNIISNKLSISTDETNEISYSSNNESSKIEEFDDILEHQNLADHTRILSNPHKNVTKDVNDNVKNGENMANNITKRLSKVSLRNEISHCISPSTELNISGSSISLSSSVEKIKSDDSFDEAFSLHLSDSGEFFDSSIKGEHERAMTGFTDTNILCKDDIEDVLEKSDENISMKKRKSSEDLKTPSKKQKMRETIDNCETDKFNLSYVEYKGSCDNSICPDLSQVEIINICKELSLLNSFSKEIRQHKIISMSLACSKIETKGPTIGCNKIETHKNDYSFGYNNTKLDGISITWGGNTVYYLSLQSREIAPKVLKVLKTILGTKNLRICLFESKEQMKMLSHCCHLDVQAKIDDPKVVEWIFDPEFKEGNLQAMCVRYCPEGIKLSQLVNCKGVGSVGLNLHSSIDSKVRSSIEAVLTWYLMDSLKKTLMTHHNYVNIYELETDIMVCLAKMEVCGFPVHKEKLQNLESKLKELQTAIEKKAFYLAGRHFNFVSSASVAKVLGINTDRRTSTRKKVLEQNKNPISDLVIQWRKINTTLTKTIHPFLRLIECDRIRGCYITYTSTGRISMHEPNLQNVAKEFRMENPMTKEIVNLNCRSAFTVPEGFRLVSADYCQIELRILTHYSKDISLTKAMRKPGDVFKIIAAKWNNVEEHMVDDSMRQNTKHLCYGIIYGMGTKALAEQLSVQEDEARSFKESFMNAYPSIQTFIKEAIRNCEKNGFVETINGRRRYLPNINDTNSSKKAQAERQAVNTIIQGSAADISKKAMVDIENELQKIFCKTKNAPKLVLHLHDELIYEVPDKYVRKVAKVIKCCMERCIELSLPFPVKLKTGQSWGTMTEYCL